LVCPPGFGQGPCSTSSGATLTLAEREKLARPFLLHAESFAVSLGPSDQSLLLYRTGGAWLALDRARAIRLYREAFASALKFEPVSLRSTVQETILNELVPLSPQDVLDLLPKADPKTQDNLYGAVINFSLMRSDYSTALRTFDESCAHGHFSERTVTHLIAGLAESPTPVPSFSSVEAARIHVFETALKTYGALDASQVEAWSASRLIARFYTQFPSEVVLPAINIVLEQAAKKDKASPLAQASVGSGDHNLSYQFRYDVELFAMAPALERFDPARLKLLLTEHPRVAEFLKRFPGGLPAFDPNDFYPNTYALSKFTSDHVPIGLQLYTSDIGAHTTGLSALDMGLEFTIPLNLNIGLGVTGSGMLYAPPGSTESELFKKYSGCSDDESRLLKESSSVPHSRKVATMCSGPMGGERCSYHDEFPRAHLFQAIAESCAWQGERDTTHAVLQEEMKLISQMEPAEQTDFLAMAADLYLRVEDEEHAQEVVKEGFTTANALLQHDLAAPGLKEVPKTVWDAAETYRRMITLGVNASFPSTEAMVQQIPDPVLREYEEVMVARALSGVPVRRHIVMYSSGSFCLGEVDHSYDRFR
jgi:hypothetical protein